MLKLLQNFIDYYVQNQLLIFVDCEHDAVKRNEDVQKHVYFPFIHLLLFFAQSQYEAFNNIVNRKKL